MAAVVGGRMEAVTPRRSLFAQDYLRLAALVAVSAAVHVWLIGHTAVTARDSIGFGRYAIGLQTPHAANPPDAPPEARMATGVDVVRRAEQPPGYPVAVWATAKFVRHLTTLPHPDAYLLAAQVANALAALLLVVPTYMIGRMLFGRAVGFGAALLLQVLPVPSRITSDGLSEGVYLLAVSVAVMLAVRAVRRPGVGAFLLCGLAVGASYLVRPEGLMVAAAAGAVGAWLGLTRRWPRDLTLGRLTALTVGVALVAVPYMLLIGKVSNKPSVPVILNPGDNPRAKTWQGQPGAGTKPVVDGPLFAEWWDAATDGGTNRVLWAGLAVSKETGKGLHYLPAVFALVGLVAFRRRVAAEPGLWVLLVLAGLNAGLLVYLAARIGYVSERHTVLLVMVGCVFAAAALEPVAAGLAALPKIGRLWAGKLAPLGLLVMLVATALPATLKPLHANREGHKYAGYWLRDRLQEHADRNEPVAVVDPFCWAEWYAGRSLYRVPADPPDARAIYCVLENTRDNPHSRLPRLELAKQVAAGGKLVYHWPEDVPADRATVHVYKTTR